jgi:hypothetical protein
VKRRCLGNKEGEISERINENARKSEYRTLEAFREE